VFAKPFPGTTIVAEETGNGRIRLWIDTGARHETVLSCRAVRRGIFIVRWKARYQEPEDPSLRSG